MPASLLQHPDMRVFCSVKLRFPSNVWRESEARVFSVDVYGRLRKLSPAAPEHRSGIVGELLQRLCKVAPKPPEKVYQLFCYFCSPLRDFFYVLFKQFSINKAEKQLRFLPIDGVVVYVSAIGQ